jgi:hypothetical protein
VFPPKRKAEHHRGTFHVRSRALVAAAYQNPHQTCWRCGHRLQDCRPHRNGKPAKWTAGHLIDGQVDGPLAPECSPCAASSGARLANLRAKARRTPTRPQRTELTW